MLRPALTRLGDGAVTGNADAQGWVWLDLRRYWSSGWCWSLTRDWLMLVLGQGLVLTLDALTLWRSCWTGPERG